MVGAGGVVSSHQQQTLECILITPKNCIISSLGGLNVMWQEGWTWLHDDEAFSFFFRQKRSDKSSARRCECVSAHQQRLLVRMREAKQKSCVSAFRCRSAGVGCVDGWRTPSRATHFRSTIFFMCPSCLESKRAVLRASGMRASRLELCRSTMLSSWLPFLSSHIILERRIMRVHFILRNWMEKKNVLTIAFSQAPSKNVKTKATKGFTDRSEWHNALR